MATNEMWNILVMGCAFMFIFTAFQTTSMIEVRKFVLKQQLLLNFPDLFLILKARSIVSNGLYICLQPTVLQSFRNKTSSHGE